jgi:mRNA interferase MazF
MKQFNVYIAKISFADDSKKVLVISPNEMNDSIKTVIVAPIVKFSGGYPTRVSIKINNEKQYVVLDQLQTIAKTMIQEEISTVDEKTQAKIKLILNEMFA